MKIKINERYIKIAFVLFVFTLLFAWSLVKAPCTVPDEDMKFKVCKYIAIHGKIPKGDDPLVRDKIWGTSYAYQPLLSYIAGGAFIAIVKNFTGNVTNWYYAARFVSVLCCTGMVVMLIKIADQLIKNKFKWIFITLTALLPQALFLGTYINNDSLAMLASSIIIYAWIIGIKSCWDRKSCIYLAIGVGLCAMSYYNAYGYILTSIILFFTYFKLNKDKLYEKYGIIKRFGLISGIVFIIAGWWFVRCGILYKGDFLGLKSSDNCAEKYAIDKFKPSMIKTPQKQGYSFYEMLTKKKWSELSYLSFIAMFACMTLNIHEKVYDLYKLFFIISILGLLAKVIKNKYLVNVRENKNKLLFNTMLLLNILIPIGLSMYYSYCSDFQPQGRYLMPLLIPFMYFVTTGFKFIVEMIFSNSKIKNIIVYIMCSSFVFVAIYSFIKVYHYYTVVF